MEEIYEVLAKSGLKDDEHIEHLIMYRWPMTRVIDLSQNLSNVVWKYSFPTLQGSSQFSFNADSDMTAQHSSCPAWDCRLSRVDQLARFAAFYSDSVYIQNYFSDYSHEPSNKDEELKVRYRLVGDIKILLKLKQLVLHNIIRFIPSLAPEGQSDICPTCFRELVPSYNKIDRYLKKKSREISAEYLDDTKVVVTLDKNFDSVFYDFNISGPDELYDHGETILEIPEGSLPKSIQRKLKSIPILKLEKGYHLSRSAIKQTRLNEMTVHDIFQDIWTQRCLCAISGSNLKYLTHRELDIRLLADLSERPDLQAYNEVIKQNLIYKLPIVLGIPLESIFEIRTNNYDAFIGFRDSIDQVILEYVSSKKPLPQSDALGIYNDVVRPKLSQLDKRVKSIHDSYARKAKGDIFVAAGLLSFGICGAFLLPEIAGIPLSLSAAETVKVVKSTRDVFILPDEIRNDNLFFLWKLLRK